MEFSNNRTVYFAFIMLAFAGMASAEFYNVTINVPITGVGNSTVFGGRLNPLPTGLVAFDNVDKRVNVAVNWTPWGEADINLTIARIWTNTTGTWAINLTNNTALGNVANQSLGNFSYIVGIPEGFFTLAINATNVTGPSRFSSNRTLIVDFTPPVYRFVTGGTNNTNTSLRYYFVNLTVNDTLSPISSCQVTNESTGNNQTIAQLPNSMNTSCEVNFTSLSDGTYNYTVSVNDSGNNFNDTSRYFFMIDGTKPAGFSLLRPSSNNSYTTYNYTFINVTFVEANPNNCILEYGNATQTANFTMNAFNNGSGGYCSFNVTGNFTVAANQTHNFTVWVNDSSGNINSTGTYFVTHDSPTGLSLRSPTNASYTTYNYTFVNFTFLDLNPNCILEYGNATQTANYTMSKFVNSTGGYCSFNVTGNFTVAANQTHNFTIWVNDSAGQINSSGAFFITHDSSIPSGLSVRLPSNNSFTTYNYTFVNFTFLDLNPNNCILEFGNATQVANYSMTKFANSTGGYCSFNVTGNFTNPMFQTHNFTVWINDSAGNLNSSGLYTLAHDSVLPTAINNASPTLGNNTFTRREWVYVNYTLTDLSPVNCTLVFTHGNGTTYNYSMQLNDSAMGTDFCYRNVTSAFTVTNQNANYTVWVTDSASNANFSSLRYVSFDNVSPYAFNLVNPTLANNSNTTNANNYVNITFTEDNLASCTLNMFTPFNGGTGANFSMSTVGETNCYFDVTIYALDAVRNYTVWVTDDSGNYNSTGPYFVRVDTTFPTAPASATPTLANLSNTSVNWLYVNYTFEETNPANCTLQFRHANNTQYNYTMTLLDTSGTDYCYRNMTGLASGLVNYTVFVTDSLSQTNASTALRTVRVDTTTPNEITFVSPASNFYNTTQPNVYVNVSFNATAPANCTLQFNNRSGNLNYSMTLVGSGSSAYCYYNVTGNFTATGQEVNFTTFITTGASLNNATSLRTVRFDNGTPTVTLTSPVDSASLTAAPALAFNYSDALTFGRCYLYIDNVLVTTISGVTGVNSTTPTGIATGTPHTWMYSCIDDAGNVGNSTSRQYSVAVSSGGSTTTTTATPTPAPAPAVVPDTSVSVPPITGGGTVEPVAPVVESESLGTSGEVSGTFTETSTQFTQTYVAPASGVNGDVTMEFPLDCADYEAGLVSIEPEPTSVTCGSVIATWSVVLAPQETFTAKVEVAKKLDPVVLKEFKAPTVVAKTPAATARPSATIAATVAATAVPTPASADNTLWYAVGAILLLGVLYYVFVGGKPKHKGL
ncbi:hypothetical protein HYV43_06390 [Candidatus Micrarchaeota archaeon]|nr:hypothetical protein [Candidatus Micrarchaeota archaeon]